MGLQAYRRLVERAGPANRYGSRHNGYARWRGKGGPGITVTRAWIIEIITINRIRQTGRAGAARDKSDCRD